MKAQEEANRMKQAENLFRRAMGKMLNASTASCFEAWATKTAESLRQKELVRKVMRRFRNIHLSQCYNQWAGAVRAAVKQRQQELWDQQQASLQQVLSRLDPDGDGVVDQDEFTTWAQQQAVR